MGYYATGYGEIEFTREISGNKEENIKHVFHDTGIELFETAFPLSDDKNLGPVKNICFQYDGKYHGDEVESALCEVSEIAEVKSGYFEFTGEDSEHWRFWFKDGSWEEQTGSVVYGGNPAVEEKDRCEFTGQIIDIFEDFLEKKGVRIDNAEGDEREGEETAILYGTDYGDLQFRLEEMMESWGILQKN